MGKPGSFFKRLTDIIVSLIVLIITSPLFLLCIIAIKLESKGPVFFIHERTGYKGQKFKMIKFRGMIDNALKYGPELTQVNDPRITKVGKFLRRTSIDELPNFINVLKGEMSIIGPRPEMPTLTAKYSDLQKKIFEFKPGVTGYSQVNGRQTLSPEQRVEMEIKYYQEENFFSDFYLLFKTIGVVISNDGNI